MVWSIQTRASEKKYRDALRRATLKKLGIIPIWLVVGGEAFQLTHFETFRCYRWLRGKEMSTGNAPKFGGYQHRPLYLSIAYNASIYYYYIIIIYIYDSFCYITIYTTIMTIYSIQCIIHFSNNILNSHTQRMTTWNDDKLSYEIRWRGGVWFYFPEG